ncbi:hypothetical protein [Cyanobium sp. CH-040]|uniref:hypothetical protein n=1 Tax=Cyanobium sp. CH-040 TaxID=2823708 RepID=UPI0020CCD092|nr:hypothetical protein [Cyanobium sp. CH-040]MCP9928698.1 hypothetical protein [Cyanobium sp. CH-040]
MGKVFTLDGINQDLLKGSRGDDIVQGSPDRPSIRNGKRGEIRLLQGDDIIRSEKDILIYGTISLESGRDVITGVRSVSLLYDWKEGLYTGFVRTGRGADRIEVSGGPLVVGEDAHLGMGVATMRFLPRIC